MTALAKRAVAAGFVWRPGFRCLVEDCPGEVGAMCVEVIDGKPTRWFVDGGCVEEQEDDEPPLPDFGHDLTRLGLLALVREAHSDPLAWVQPTLVPGSVCLSVRWRVMLAAGTHGEQASSAIGPFGESDRVRSEALVAALEAAPS